MAAVIGGIGLLVMAVLAANANFGIMETLIVPGDAQSTAQNIMASSGSFRFGIISFLFVAVLDVVVAWSLYVILKPANKNLSLAAAWLRIIYAVIFAFSLTKLFGTLQLLTTSGSSQVNDINALAMNRINEYQTGWDIGLIFFGVHLLLISFISLKFGTIPKWLGAFLAIAGLGYLVDSIAILLVPASSISIGEYTFIGEVVLIFWLLWKGIKGFSQSKAVLA